LVLLFACASGAWAEPRVRRNVEIEFETIPGASLYEVQIVRKDDKSKKPQRFKMSTPTWSSNIKPGLYLMQTRSYDDRGAPGDWSPPVEMKVRLPAIIVNGPAPGEVISAGNPKAEEVNFSWEQIPGAKSYRIMLKGENDSFKMEHEVSEPKWSGKVPSGNNVSWNAVAIDENGEDGEFSSEHYQFQLVGPALDKPKIDKPYSKFVQEVTWSKPDHASRYSYQLARQNPATKAWEPVETVDNLKDNKAILDIGQPSGRYRLYVQAHSPYRVDSQKSGIEFYMEGGFKNQDDYDKAMLRDGITKPSKFYAIASYMYTTMNYASVNYDHNSRPAFGASGGTGRVGAGFQEPKSKFGGFAIADISGFDIQSNRYTFVAAEAHITRRLEMGQGGLLLFGTGLYFKELPILSGTASGGFNGLGKVNNIGPHAGFTFWQPLKARYGMQLNARAYYTLLGSGNGKEVESALSYQYGVLGSYRLDKNTQGYAGYAYRKDEAKYGVDADNLDLYSEPGQINTISIDGHYINLILEFSF